ncbi:MAG: hypothetical protein AAF311_10125 [Pseudomonadota bacterium]
MAKAKTTTKTAKAKKAEASTLTTTLRPALRKASLAYVGLYGLAYERAQFRADQLKTASGTLFDTLVKKGEVLETKGLELTKDAREKATELVEDSVETARNIVPFGGRDNRVEELEAEVAALNKKIAALSKKASTPRKAVKTETTKTTPATEKKAA